MKLPEEEITRRFNNWWDNIEFDYDWEYQSQYSCARMAYLKAFREGFIEGLKDKNKVDS